MPPRRRRSNGRFVSEKDLGWDEIFAQIEAESKRGAQVVDVGWDDPEQASKALVIEFGTRHRAAHPFIRTTFDTRRKAYKIQLTEALAAVSDGKAGKKALHKAGELLAADLADASPVDTGDLLRAIVIKEGTA